MGYGSREGGQENAIVGKTARGLLGGSLPKLCNLPRTILAPMSSEPSRLSPGRRAMFPAVFAASTEEFPKGPTDCMTCRATGGGVLGAVSCYTAFRLYQTPKPETGNRIALAGLTAITAGLAVYRALGI